MPRIPTNEQNQNVQPQLTAPLRNEAAANYAPLNQVTDVLTQVTQTWQTAEDNMQKTNAIANQATSDARIDAASASDTGVTEGEDGELIFTDTTEQYIAQKEASKANALAGIKNGAVREQVAAQMDMEIAVSRIRMSTDFKNKQVEFNKSRLGVSLAAAAKRINTAETPALKAEAIEFRDNLLRESVLAGTITLKEKEDMQSDAEMESVKFDIYAETARFEDASDTLAQIEDREGKYKFLDETQRLEATRLIKDRIFQNNQTYERAVNEKQDETVKDVYQKMLDGEMSLAYLDAVANLTEEEGGLPPKQMKNLYSGYMRDVGDSLKRLRQTDTAAQEYIEVVENIMSEGADKNKAREIIATAYADGVVLSHEDMVVLNALKTNVKDIKANKHRQKTIGNINVLKRYFGNMVKAKEADLAIALKELLASVNSEEDIDTVAEKIMMADTRDRNPYVAWAGVTGTVLMDDKGLLKKVFGDGHTEEVK